MRLIGYMLRKVFNAFKVRKYYVIKPESLNTKKFFIHIRKRYLDVKYRTCDYKEFEFFVKVVRPIFKDLIKYKRDYFDCDDFAQMFCSLTKLFLKINAIGIAEGYHNRERHRWNIFIDKDYNIYFVEPQTCKIMKIDEATNYLCDYVEL